MKLFMILFLTFSTLQAQKIYAIFDVYASKDASLAFIASGIVSKVYVDINSHVKKDQLLASLQNDDIKASLQMAKITLKYAKKAYERELKVRHLIDAGKFDTIQKAYEEAKAAYAYQKALYDKTFLKAPFDGVIYAKDIEVGDAVSGMMLKTVFKIQSQHKRKLRVCFDQKYKNDVHVGDLFIYRIDANTQSHQAPIAMIYPSANSKNRKICADVYANDLTPGLFGDGYIITNKE